MMKVFSMFIGRLLIFWFISTALFTLVGAALVFDSGDWSRLIPFLWQQGFYRLMFGLFFFTISPSLAMIFTVIDCKYYYDDE